MIPHEIQELDWYKNQAYNTLTPERQQRYAFLMQKSRIPQTMQTIPPMSAQQMPKQKKKVGQKRVVHKSDGALGAWILGGVILLMCARFIYVEYSTKQPSPKTQDAPAKVVYSKRRT
jgi:hypothetical protein